MQNWFENNKFWFENSMDAVKFISALFGIFYKDTVKRDQITGKLNLTKWGFYTFLALFIPTGISTAIKIKDHSKSERERWAKEQEKIQQDSTSRARFIQQMDKFEKVTGQLNTLHQLGDKGLTENLTKFENVNSNINTFQNNFKVNSQSSLDRLQSLNQHVNEQFELLEARNYPLTPGYIEVSAVFKVAFTKNGVEQNQEIYDAFVREANGKSIKNLSLKEVLTAINGECDHRNWSFAPGYLRFTIRKNHGRSKITYPLLYSADDPENKYWLKWEENVLIISSKIHCDFMYPGDIDSVNSNLDLQKLSIQLDFARYCPATENIEIIINQPPVIKFGDQEPHYVMNLEQISKDDFSIWISDFWPGPPVKYDIPD